MITMEQAAERRAEDAERELDKVTRQLEETRANLRDMIAERDEIGRELHTSLARIATSEMFLARAVEMPDMADGWGWEDEGVLSDGDYGITLAMEDSETIQIEGGKRGKKIRIPLACVEILVGKRLVDLAVVSLEATRLRATLSIVHTGILRAHQGHSELDRGWQEAALKVMENGGIGCPTGRPRRLDRQVSASAAASRGPGMPGAQSACLACAIPASDEGAAEASLRSPDGSTTTDESAPSCRIRPNMSPCAAKGLEGWIEVRWGTGSDEFAVYEDLSDAAEDFGERFASWAAQRRGEDG